MSRGLKVSGVKEELIQRLQSFEDGLNKVVSITITDLEAFECSDAGSEEDEEAEVTAASTVVDQPIMNQPVAHETVQEMAVHIEKEQLPIAAKPR